MSYKMKEKILTNEEFDERQIKGYELIKSYEINFDKESQEIELEIEKDIYDEYKIGIFSNGKIKKLKTKKIKDKENKVVKVVATVKECGEYIVYGRNANKLIIIEAAMGLMLFLAGFGFAYSTSPEFKDTVDEFLIETFNIDTPTAPTIDGGSDTYAKERIIKVVKDSKSNSGISHYEYCISSSEDMSKCKWVKTNTKSVVVNTTGVHYVAFRGVSNEGTKGNISNIEIVKIDNDSPVIEDIKVKYEDGKIKVEVISKDNLKEDLKYYYKIDDGNYVEVEKDFELEIDGKHKVTIRVEDSTGNFIEVEKEIDFNEIKGTTPKEDENIETEEPNEVEKPSEDTPKEDSNKENSDKEEQTKEENIEIPEINLDKVPTSFEYGENYKLPSYYKFDSQGGDVVCTLDNQTEISDTKRIGIGKHIINCKAIGNNGYTTTVEKEIEVKLITELEEVWDGYVILTLYYPENSTDWQWRLGKENEIRTGYDNTGWQDYTGPIKVRLEDISNVYIKYKIGNKEIIEAPNGQLVVDIRPSRYTIKADEKTKVKIYYDEKAETKEYKINDGSWKKYEGSFEVGPNTIIEARASKTEKVYDEEGNLLLEYKTQANDSVFVSQYIPITGSSTGSVSSSVDYETTYTPSYSYTSPTKASKPSYYLEGPAISVSPTEIVEEAQVTITPQYEASAIYYSIDGGSYKQYTDPITVNDNVLVASYYIKKDDGKKSDITYKRVDNINQHNLPYLRIDATPDPYIDSKADKVIVNLVGRNYDTIEYSFDGIYYENYTGSLELTESKTAYARATNENGTTYKKLVINNLPQITVPEKLDVEIISKDLYDNGLATASTIKIIYDESATTKLYKVGSSDSWHEYTGEFTINRNATIYAYCSSDAGYGEKEKRIRSLYTGMSDPKIIANPDENLQTTSVKITIDYDQNAVSKKYRIGNQELTDYTKEFEVTKNTVIYAESIDALGNKTTSTYQIDNIIAPPSTYIIDKGMYYLIKLNYPTTSSESGREYKWKTNGEWKVYPKEGILLIKSQYKDAMLDLKENDILMIEDDNGKKVEFKGHYYVLDMPANQMMENLFMRWDTVQPEAPIITVTPTTWTSKAVVKIEYPEAVINKQYKIVYEDGTTTGWKPYTKAITETNNNATVYARYQDYTEVYSKVAEKTLTNIDNGNPGVRYVSVVGNTQNSITISIDGLDTGSGIKEYYYSLDGKNFKVSKSNVITINNLYANSEYKIYTYVVDNAGNEGEIYDIIGTTRNILSPEIKLTPDINTWSESKTLTVEHIDDTLDLYYSTNKGKTWITYESPVEIDSKKSIMAKASDGLNEATTAIYEIKTIDTTKPTIKNINVLERSSRLVVSVNAIDKDSGIKEYYYSIDGENYTNSIEDKYQITGLNNETEYTIYVKVMNNAGIMSEVSEIKATTTDIGEFGYFVTPDNNKWGYDKEVEIDYPTEEDQGYINQYSLDEGKTWKDYDGPIMVTEEGKTVIARVIDGPNIKVASSFKVTKIDRFEPKIDLDLLPEEFYTSDTYSLPSSYTVDETKSGGSTKCSVNGVEYTNTNQLPGGKYTIECSVTTGAGRSASVTKDVNAIYQETKEVESLLKGIEDDSLTTGYYAFKVETEEETITYPVHLIVLDGDQTWSENQTFGDANDVATSNENAKRMVIVKVNGNVTINEGVEVGPYYDPSYGGPKGFMLYVTGKLTNNGTIDNSHGAKAEGQNVYLWKNADGTYEYVPAAGAAGADKVNPQNSGKAGANGSGRETGGGGSGAATGTSNNQHFSGAGGAGTSYSGGTGGGATTGFTTAQAGFSNGGPGGAAYAFYSAGGAGNPGGLARVGGRHGSNGTGGLLIIFADQYENNGTLKSTGSAGGNGTDAKGGSSGGGSINIFTNQSTGVNQLGVITDTKYNEMLGTTNLSGGSIGNGGAGGTGTVSIGEIRKNQYYDLKEIIEQDKESYKETVTYTGDSILSIVKNKLTKSGYYYLKVNGEEYPVHLIVLDGDQTWSENQTFGDASDVATATTNAQNMVIVKVNGNVTVNEGVEVGPYYDPSYGGPKGFMLYVTGKLTNNGTIDNSHGAKAEGQNVYLWKNVDGTYEYVPAAGAAGADKVNPQNSGKAGANGSGRETGGGGSGAAGGTSNSEHFSGAGGAGTSYSGGTGGGATTGYTTAQAGFANGGAGGAAYAFYSSAGAGNPGGASTRSVKGSDGTGGLLIIFADNYENNGTLKSTGSNGGNANTGWYSYGGSSGGGSINVFYNKEISKGLTNVAGGSMGNGGAGGSGTVTYTQISMSTTSTFSLRPTETPIVVDNPKYTVNNLSTVQKELTITYPQGYKNEYSLDGGTTWLEYANPLIIEKNGIIFARSTSDNKVVSSSTIKITTIEEKEIVGE